MDLPTARDVIDFWFGEADQPRVEWFRKDAAFDAGIRQRFGALVEAALAGAIDAWADAGPAAALAHIVVLDQFPRNAWRDTPRAFAGDRRALAAARRLVDRGEDRTLSPVRRAFAYLPYEHAEDPAMQRRALELFDQPGLEDALVWARKHQVIIERFGRFPHRNLALGRVSSDEELAFLHEPDSSF